MKKLLLIGLVIELVFGGLLMVVLFSPASLAQGGESTDNTTSSLTGLLPDIEKIYHAALTTPLREVEHEIQDEEIAEFYHRLLQKYELDEP